MEKWKAETQEKLFDPVSAFHLSLSSFQLFTMSAFPLISVVIPACNPGMRHFQIVLDALRDQTLPKDCWELILVDDASRTPLALRDGRAGEKAENLKIGKAENEGLRGEKPDEQQRTDLTKNEALIDLSWHPNARLVQTDLEREGGGEKAENLKSAKAENEGACGEREGIGLVSARLRGFELGKGDVFVFVDQDNALRPDYLQGVADIALEYPHIGTWGGQILLKFDEPEKAPEKRLWGSLCTREVESDVWSNVADHHPSTPCGAGLCARREVLRHYRTRVLTNPLRRLLDPTPRGPGFGGDTDVAYAGIEIGYGKGIFKRLVLDHLTPVGRCSDDYILRNAEGLAFSSALHGYVDTGRVIPPRDDMRFWIMNWLRRPGMARLDWDVLVAQHRGRRRAVEEVELRGKDLRAYARRLHEKAVALNH